MAEYGHIYPYMHSFSTQGVCKTYSQCIHTQKAGAHYTKLTQACVPVCLCACVICATGTWQAIVRGEPLQLTHTRM